jgi:hypothetical protein
MSYSDKRKIYPDLRDFASHLRGTKPLKSDGTCVTNCPSPLIFRGRRHTSGRSAAWQAHLPWEQGVGGSNPPAPTNNLKWLQAGIGGGLGAAHVFARISVSASAPITPPHWRSSMKMKKGMVVVVGFLASIFLLGVASSVSAGDGVTRYWAVVVGVSDYLYVDDLQFAAADATAIYNLLLQDSRWSAERVILLTNSQASRSAVRDAVLEIAGKSDDDDVFLFLFSGHGGQADEDFPPIDEADGRDEYISLWDTNYYDYSGDFIDDDLGELIGQVRATKVVLIDSCFSGGNVKGLAKEMNVMKVNKGGKSKFLKKPFEQHLGVNKTGDGFASDLVHGIRRTKDPNDQSNIIVLTACDDDELTYESPEFYHGEFTYFLLLGLQSNDINKDGDVSAEEAFAYLYPALRKYRNSTVTPQQYDATSGEVHLVQPIAGRLVFVGNISGFSWDFPFNTYYEKRRAEYLYYPSQLGAGGNIKTLKIFADEAPLLPLDNCTIRMQNTSFDAYNSPAQWTSSGWATVYSGRKSISNTGPVTFELSTPFFYDGVGNLIIDFSFSNSDHDDHGFFFGSYSDTYSMIYYSTNTDSYGEPTSWSGTSPPPQRDDNSPEAAGSYLDLELGFQNVNRSPVLNPIGDKTVNEGETLQFTVTASDPDGDSLSYAASNLPTGATFDPATQTFTWTPNFAQAGNYLGVHFEVWDGVGGIDSENIEITVNPGVGQILTDIKANATDGSVTVSPQDTLSITVALDNNGRTDNADWWLAANTPFGLYFYTSTGWTANVQPAYQGSLFNLPAFQVVNIPASALPAGTYTFYSGVDTVMDGTITMENAYYDFVQVNIVK